VVCTCCYDLPNNVSTGSPQRIAVLEFIADIIDARTCRSRTYEVDISVVWATWVAYNLIVVRRLWWAAYSLDQRAASGLSACPIWLEYWGVRRTAWFIVPP
jgi:hypothetical protein